MRDLMNRIEELWCVHMHTATMWPIHGKYRCGACLREYAVPFEAAQDPRDARGVSLAEGSPARLAA